MKYRMYFLAILTVLLSVGFYSRANCQLTDILKGAQNAMSTEQGDSSSQEALGLREALKIGAKNAVSSVSKINGYYENPDIKILLPDSIKKFESILRGAGLGQQVDNFELSMNRAAEKAAPEAKALFIDAVKEMTFQDAQKILRGPDNAATQYFREKTETELSNRFEPIVEKAISEVGVTNHYQSISEQIQQIPLVNLSSFDLNRYVTQNALDGLFFMVAQEEKKIRENPAARVTDLLKKVFGNGK